MEQQPQTNPRPFIQPYRGTGFATAALLCGVMSVMSCMIFYVTFFFGCMSILFAFLSRQDSFKMPSISKIGLGISIIGIVLTSVLTAGSLAFLLETFGLEMILQQPDQILEELLKMMEVPFAE
jgi:hypothetical protein